MAGTVALAIPAFAQDSNHLHPVLGKSPPREVLNKDILALPQKERMAWIHGAISATITMLHVRRAGSVNCVNSLFFGNGDGIDVLLTVMQENPNFSANAAMVAVADQACPDVTVQVD